MTHPRRGRKSGLLRAKRRERERFLPKSGKGQSVIRAGKCRESPHALILGSVQEVTRPWRERLPGTLREGLLDAECTPLACNSHTPRGTPDQLSPHT